MPAKEGSQMLFGLKQVTAVCAAAVISVSLSACAIGDGSTDEVTVVTHDSAVFTDAVVAEFKAQTGITIKQIKAGDAGELTNKLVLTKDAPIADVVYGIDNTFLDVAIENGVIEGTPEQVDFGDVCINYDKSWFSQNELPVPTTIKDLTKPAYKGLTVLTNPTTSSPGLAFLAATVSVFGENGWEQYWQALKANDVKIAAGWEDAYFNDFSGSSGKGDYPIVLSYSSSPAFEIREYGESQTESLLTDCFRQTEYVAVLKNTKNPTAAKKLALFLINDPFQSTLADSMYVYPTLPGVALPETWAEWAPAATKTVGGELKIAANRKDWFTKWSEIFSAN
jgi:thiamine transport system substrate-binding protein